MHGWKRCEFAWLALVLTTAACGTGSRAPANGEASRIAVAAVTSTVAARQSAETLRECERAASRAGFPIACPTVLPPGSTPFWSNGFGVGGGCNPSPGPTLRPRWTWVGAYVRTGHVFGRLVMASAPRRVAPRAFIYWLGTARPHRSPHVTIAEVTTVRGHVAEYVHPSRGARLRARGGIFLGHTVLIWTERGRTYAIGVTGRHLHARKVEAMDARRLVFATPPAEA